MSTQILQELGFSKKIAFSNIYFKARNLKWKMSHKMSILVIRENALQHTIKIFVMGANHKTKEKRLVDNVNFTQMTLM